MIKARRVIILLILINSHNFLNCEQRKKEVLANDTNIQINYLQAPESVIYQSVGKDIKIHMLQNTDDKIRIVYIERIVSSETQAFTRRITNISKFIAKFLFPLTDEQVQCIIGKDMRLISFTKKLKNGYMIRLDQGLIRSFILQIEMYEFLVELFEKMDEEELCIPRLKASDFIMVDKGESSYTFIANFFEIYNFGAKIGINELGAENEIVKRARTMVQQHRNRSQNLKNITIGPYCNVVSFLNLLVEIEERYALYRFFCQSPISLLLRLLSANKPLILLMPTLSDSALPLPPWDQIKAALRETKILIKEILKPVANKEEFKTLFEKPSANEIHNFKQQSLEEAFLEIVDKIKFVLATQIDNLEQQYQALILQKESEDQLIVKNELEIFALMHKYNELTEIRESKKHEPNTKNINLEDIKSQISHIRRLIKTQKKEIKKMSIKQEILVHQIHQIQDFYNNFIQNSKDVVS